MITITLQQKNPASLKLTIKQGVDPGISDIASLTFNDVLLPDGTLVKDTTFLQLQNTAWSNTSKNQTTLTNAIKP